MLLRQLSYNNIDRNSSRSSRGHLLVTNAVKAKSARQICCSKTLVAKPDSVDAVQQLCKHITDFSVQQMSNRSNGIQEFTCAVDAWESNVFHFWERYESNAAMGRYNTKPEVVKFMEEVRPASSRASSCIALIDSAMLLHGVCNALGPYS